jgi:hypothetical protein
VAVEQKGAHRGGRSMGLRMRGCWSGTSVRQAAGDKGGGLMVHLVGSEEDRAEAATGETHLSCAAASG